MTENITNLITKIAPLNTEINIKVNNLVKIHLNELDELILKLSNFHRVSLHCKCKVCGWIIRNKNEVIDNIRKEHEAKLFMEKNHNIIVCLKARH